MLYFAYPPFAGGGKKIMLEKPYSPEQIKLFVLRVALNINIY